VIPGGGSLLCPHPDGTLYIAGGQDLHRLKPVGIAEQLEQLLVDEQFSTALYLAATLPGGTEVPRIHGRQAIHLLEENKFEEAFEHLGESKLSPGRAIALLPRLLPTSQVVEPLAILELNPAEEKKLLIAMVAYLEGLRSPLVIPTWKGEPGVRKMTGMRKSLELDGEAGMIDTALLQAFVSLKMEASLDGLLSKPHFCRLEESEKACNLLAIIVPLT